MEVSFAQFIADLRKDERILVFHDSDADGVTGWNLLLQKLGLRAFSILNSRFAAEGGGAPLRTVTGKV